MIGRATRERIGNVVSGGGIDGYRYAQPILCLLRELITDIHIIQGIHFACTLSTF